MVSDSNDETYFHHKLLLTDTQVLRLSKAFANGLSAVIKFSKTQLFKMIKLGGFLIPSVPLSLFDSLPPVKMVNSIANSYEKELKDMDPTALEKNEIIEALMIFL